MATIYGATTNHWRCYINTWSSEDGYSVSAGLTVGIQDCGWGFQIWTGIVGHSSANGADSEVNTSFNTSTGSWTTKDITSSSQRFVKGHSAYNVTLSGWVRNQSGYMNGTSSASQTITVPALAHHYVSFDANGGTGAPDRADKWYGEQVTIPTTKPTRTNYEFLGWSSSSSSTVQYKPGEKYWIDDKDMTFYAVWKLLYVPPKFTAGLCLRTKNATSTVEDPSGEYIYGSFSWLVDTTVYTDNKPKSIVVQYFKDDDTTGTTVSLTGDTTATDGTVNFHFPAALESNYTIAAQLTDDKNGTATIARSVGNGSIPIEVSNKGRSIGIMSTAPQTAGVQIGSTGNPEFGLTASTSNGALESMVQIHGSTSATGQGELTISTQGLDSEGNVARGSFNLIADGLKLNGIDQSELIQVVSEKNFEQRKYSDGRLITFMWFTDADRDGVNTTVGCSYKMIKYTIPYKKVNLNLCSAVNTREVGFYGKFFVGMCENKLTGVACQIFLTENFPDIWFQGVVIGVWK